jgi:hypothetical protein
MTRVCKRCETPVVYENVSKGYFAICPSHDEDLYSFETVIVGGLVYSVSNKKGN